MVDFADQAALPFERFGHFALGFFDPVDRAGKGVAQARWISVDGPSFSRQVEFALRRADRQCTARSSRRSGRTSSRLTSSQVISAAAIHISTGSSRTSRSTVVIRWLTAPIRATMICRADRPFGHPSGAESASDGRTDDREARELSS